MPFVNQVHINRPLTNISIAYIQDEKSFIADKIFPTIPVQKQSNVYFIYDQSNYLKDDVQERAPGAEAPLINSGIKVSDPYHCRMYALAEKIPMELIENQDEPLNVEFDATIQLTHKMLINKEINFVNNFFKAKIWATEYDGSTIGFWSDYTKSTPLKNIRNAITTVQLQTGYRPNTLVLTRPVYDALIDHPDFLDRVLYKPVGSEAVVDSPVLATLFGLKNVYIMDSTYDTQPEGVSKNTAFIGGKNALLLYVPNNPGLRTPAAGYKFSWQGVYSQLGGRGAPVGGGDTVITSYWWQKEKSTYVEAHSAYCFKIIGKDLGVFFNNIIQ